MNAAHLAIRILDGGSAAIVSPLVLSLATIVDSDPSAGALGFAVTVVVFIVVALLLARIIQESLRPGPPSWLVIAAAAVLPLLALAWARKWATS